MAGTGVMRDGARILRDPQGQLVQVDPEKADYLLEKGVGGKLFHDVSEKEVLARDIEATNSTLGSKVETFARTAAESAGDIARLGQYTPSGLLAAKAIEGATGYDTIQQGRSLPSQALGLAGGDASAYDERTRFLERINPGTAAAGSLTGQLLPAIATGGASMAAGQSLGGALAATGLRQGVAKAVGAGAAMAVEGAAYGAASAETSARQAGQTDGATAEQLLQGIGLGAVLGGGLGAGMSATGSLFRKLVSKADEVATPAVATAQAETALAEQAAQTTVQPGKLARLYNELASTLTGSEKSTLDKYGIFANDAEAISGRQLWKARGEIIDEATTKMTSAVEQFDQAAEVLGQRVRNAEMKMANVGPKLEADGITAAAARSAAKEQVEGGMSALQRLREALPENSYSRAVRKEIDTALDIGADSLRRAVGKDATAESAYIAVDGFKRHLQRTKLSLERTELRAQDGITQRYAREASDALEREIQEPMRQSLENPQIWGEQAAAAQREINASTKRMIETQKRYKSELFGQTGNVDYFTGRPTSVVESGKVKSWISSTGTTEGATRQAAVRDHLSAQMDMIEAIAKHHDLGPSELKALEQARAASRELSDTIGRVDKTAAVANEIDQVIAKERGAAQLVGPGMGIATGALLGGPIGALAGGALGMILRPGSAIAASEAVHAIGQRMGIKTTGAASSWLKEATGLAKDGARRVASATAGTARFAGKVAVPASVAIFVGKSKSLEKAYEEKTRQLIRAKQDPDFLLDSLTRVSGGLASVSPSVAGAFVAKTSAAIDYLAAEAPAGTISPTPLNPARKSIVSRLEMQRFARIWAAVEKPMTVIDDLRRGMATPDQIRALRAVHPETYEAIRMQVSNDLIEVAQKGGRIPLNVRQQLDLLLDLDGAGEPAFSPRVADRILRAQEAQKAKQQQSRPRKAPNFAHGAQLPQDSWPSMTAKG